jgi:uncharacterized protein YqfB (UPF0267 family)
MLETRKPVDRTNDLTFQPSYRIISAEQNKGEKMETFRFELHKVLEIGDALLSMMEKRAIPHAINIRNIPYLVIPNAVKFFNYFKKPLLTPIEEPENSVITIDDFNNHMIVPASDIRINVFSNGRYISSIDLLAISQIVGTFGEQYVKGIRYNYNFLRNTLPLDLENSSNSATHKFVIVWSDTLIKTSTLILTFIYTLTNLNEKVKIVSNSDPSDVAVKYIEALRDELRNLGDNFFEVIENLYILKLFT